MARAIPTIPGIARQEKLDFRKIPPICRDKGPLQWRKLGFHRRKSPEIFPTKMMPRMLSIATPFI